MGGSYMRFAQHIHELEPRLRACWITQFMCSVWMKPVCINTMRHGHKTLNASCILADPSVWGHPLYWSPVCFVWFRFGLHFSLSLKFLDYVHQTLTLNVSECVSLLFRSAVKETTILFPRRATALLFGPLRCSTMQINCGGRSKALESSEQGVMWYTAAVGSSLGHAGSLHPGNCPSAFQVMIWLPSARRTVALVVLDMLLFCMPQTHTALERLHVVLFFIRCVDTVKRENCSVHIYIMILFGFTSPKHENAYF